MIRAVTIGRSLSFAVAAPSLVNTIDILQESIFVLRRLFQNLGKHADFRKGLGKKKSEILGIFLLPNALLYVQ